jgi:hypothetical protein
MPAPPTRFPQQDFNILRNNNICVAHLNGMCRRGQNGQRCPYRHVDRAEAMKLCVRSVTPAALDQLEEGEGIYPTSADNLDPEDRISRICSVSVANGHFESIDAALASILGPVDDYPASDVATPT